MSDQSTQDLRDAISQVQYWRAEGRPDLAEKQIDAILEARPGEINATFMLAVLRREAERYAEAVALLKPIVKAAPGFVVAVMELAAAQRGAGHLDEALETLNRLVAEQPSFSPAWRRLGDALIEAGQVEEGRRTYARAAHLDPFRPQMERAMKALNSGQPAEAEAGLKEVLRQDPEHIYAIIGLATLAIQSGQLAIAERLLDQAEHICPNLDVVWQHKARLKFEQNAFADAEVAARRLTELAPDRGGSWHVLGDIQSSGSSLPDAPDSYRKGLTVQPDNVQLHVGLGHALRSLGKAEDATAAFRAALKRKPEYGEAYWALSDMKTVRFEEADIELMHAALSNKSADIHNRIFLNFALGKAREDAGDSAAAFAHFADGNELQASLTPFSPAQFDTYVSEICPVVPAERTPVTGSDTPTPIFIVGLPRSGSTLVEQILASHSAIEGTMELPHMPQYAKMLAAEYGSYGEALDTAEASVFEAIGQRYLKETAGFREGRPYFIDKLPGNFLHIPLITRALPQAVIVDVRRNPLDCGLSCFKQYFSQGQAFSYDLEAIGHYYKSYVALMADWAKAAPGRVLTQSYEDLVSDPEANISKLVEACGVDMEEACLSFHTVDRNVRTASSEQVRQPMNSKGVGRWKRYETELEPLVKALGPELTSGLV